MHPDHLVGAFGRRSDLGNADGRSIGGQDHARAGGRVRIAEDFELEFWILGSGFDHQVGLTDGVHIADKVDPQRRISLRLGDGAFAEQFFDRFANRGLGFLQRGREDIHAGDVISRSRGDLGDAVAHCPRADDEDVFNFHVHSP